MTKLSKFQVDPEKFGHYVNNLWSAFTLMDSKEDIRLLFKDMFTHTEYKMFAKRLEIARRLLSGETYETIMNDLKVTSRTITSVNNTLVFKGEGYRKANIKLDRIDESYKKKLASTQDQLERRTWRRTPGEKVLGEVLKYGLTVTQKAVSKKIKQKSAKRKLSV